MSNQRRRSQQRLARFEQFEKRLMMTADPVGSLLPPIDLALTREPMTAEVAAEFVAPIAPSEFPAVELPLNQDVAIDPQSVQSAASLITEPTVESITQVAQLTNNPVSEAAAIGAQFGFDGSGQTIAVIDSGIAYDHAAFGNGFGAGSQVVGGYDFAENDANPYDDAPGGFHGTHVAGIIGSQDSRYQGVSSGADLVALRVFDDQGRGNLDWVEQALQWVHENRNSFENPITTVNLSLGTNFNADNTPNFATLEDEFAQLEADGIFISVAAGNAFQEFNAPGLSYPAVSPSVVPVASHGSDGTISDFSQRNDRVLVAPGESIRSTVPSFLFGSTGNNSFLGASGTSQAAPYVAGASALLRQAFESIGVTEVNQDLLYQQFRDTANQIFDSVTGQNFSQINLEAAISAVLEMRPEAEAPVAEAPAVEAPVAETPAEQTPATPETPQAPAQTPPAAAVPDASPQPSQPPNQTPAQPPASQPRAVFDGWTIRDRVLVVNGTAGDDTVSVDVSNSFTTVVSVNGTNRQFNSSRFDRIQIQGRGGDDQLSVTLGQADESVIVSEGSLHVTSNGTLRFGATQFASVDVTHGGGEKLLTLLDSAGNDHVEFNAAEVTASITIGDFVATGHGFDDVFSNSTGGHDSVVIIGSHGADRFVSRDFRNLIVNDSLRATANNFSDVQFVGNGGNDHANLLGTSGRDQFELSPREALLRTSSATIRAEDIGRFNAFSHDGLDQLKLYDSAGDDLYALRGNNQTVEGDGFLSFAWNFTDTQVFASGGHDVAQIQDTAGDDHLSAVAGDVTFVTREGVTRTNDFDRVNVIASHGGHDTASIRGTTGNDTVYATHDAVTAELANGQINRAVGFDDVQFDGGRGEDQVTLAGSSGNETLTVNHDEIVFQSTLQMLQLVNAENTNFRGNGGFDEVVIEEFESMDLLSSLGDSATAFLRDRQVTVTDFDSLEAETVDDALAQFDLDDADFDYLLLGNWKRR